jgi:hypothetical protein
MIFPDKKQKSKNSRRLSLPCAGSPAAVAGQSHVLGHTRYLPRPLSLSAAKETAFRNKAIGCGIPGLRGKRPGSRRPGLNRLCVPVLGKPG